MMIFYLFSKCSYIYKLAAISMTTLQQYFKLQITMLKRQVIEFGVNPILGFLVIVLCFYGFSYYLFTKTEYANYIYVLAVLSIIIQFSEPTRNDFLKFTFQKSDYYKIRILENIIAVTPFIIFLIWKQAFYIILILVLASILVAFWSTTQKTTLTIPTPFYKKPFEFIVGFRKSILGFIFAYALTIISCIYLNFNLGIFSLILIFLLCLSFYTEPENEFYVWVHHLKVKKFLLDKITTAFIFSSIISFPIIISLLVFFSTNSKVIFGFQALGYCYLLTVILAKYSTFPRKINLPQGVLLAMSIAMPLLLLVVIPFFYIQSNRRLKEILE